MRTFHFQKCALVSSLLAGALFAACSTGSDSPGASGSGGSAGSGSGGSSSSDASSGTGSGGSVGTGTGGAVAGVDGGGTGGASVPSVCDGAGTRILTSTDNKVDDFEGAMMLPGWSTFNDVVPPDSIKLMPITPGAAGTAHAVRYTGMGAKTPDGTTPDTKGYGVGAIYNAAIDTMHGIYCIDISAFDGVSFWAKAGTAGAKVALNFVIAETNAKTVNGDCVTNCYSHPRKTLALTTDWAPYSVTFAEAGMGTAKVKTRIQELGWLSPDSNWDFSIDEIQFYKGTPPTGAVGP